MSVISMRVKSTTATDGKTKTKTFSPLEFASGQTATERGKAIKYMAQRLVALTTNTYVETDMIETTNVDSLEVTNVG